MQNSFTNWGGNDLYHFGVRGMRWGQRRFQNEDGSLTSLGRARYGEGGYRSARGTKHDLNKLDREQVNARARFQKYSNAANKATAKVNKKMWDAQAAGDKKKIRALRKEQKKIDSTTGKKAAQYKKLLDRSKSMTDKILAASANRGYKVKTKMVVRHVKSGKLAALNTLSAVGAGTLGALTGVGVGVGVTKQGYGTHYSVRKGSYGDQMYNSLKSKGLSEVAIKERLGRR